LGTENARGGTTNERVSIALDVEVLGLSSLARNVPRVGVILELSFRDLTVGTGNHGSDQDWREITHFRFPLRNNLRPEQPSADIVVGGLIQSLSHFSRWL
jgi:hypothetical protein